MVRHDGVSSSNRSRQVPIDNQIYAGDLGELREIHDHDGLSGARISRGFLRSGTPIVVKRSSWAGDLFQRRLRHRVSLEHLLWQDGTLRRLPSGLESAILGTWVEGDTAVIVMADLGDTVLGSNHEFSREELGLLIERVDRLHHANIQTKHGTGLEPLISLFSAPGLRLEGADALADEVDHGWSVFADLAPSMATPVRKLLADPSPIVVALAEARPTLCHGDIASVNLAWRADDLILLDWGQAFRGPAALEIARFLPSGLVHSDIDPDTFLDDYRAAARDRFDRDALDMAILAALIWYGWRKAIDVSETADPVRRARELDNLHWWCDRARPGLRATRSP